MKIDIHTHHQNGQSDLLAIVNQYPSQINLELPYFSIGIHPWYIKEDKVEAELGQIEKTIVLSNCLAIGECGLDKKGTIPLELQIKVFRQQLLLAEKYKKAVILHVVSAYQEVIALKKEMQITVPLIVHGFAKNKQVAESLYKNGFYVSFGKALVLNEKMKEVLLSVPKNYIFLETDNAEDITIEQVYKAGANAQFDIEQVVRQNFENVFNI